MKTTLRTKATEKNQVGRDARTDFASFARMQAAKKVTRAVTVDRIDQAEQIVSYATVAQFQGMPELNWSVLLAQDTAMVFEAQRRLLPILFG